MYAFVHIDKTAGTTLNNILRRSLGTRHCDIRLPIAKRRDDGRDHRGVVEAADLRRVRRLYRNLRGIAGHNVKAFADLASECPQIQFFTVLRDPVSRFRSHFLNRSGRYAREDFERWTDSPWVQNWQTRMIAGEPSAEKAIDLLESRFGFVGLTEKFDESLVLLGHWLREPGFQAEYRPLNQLAHKTRPRDIARQQTDTSYLKTDAALRRMQQANAEDQKVYDYVTSTVYVRQVADYPGDLSADVRSLQRRHETAERLVEPVASSLMRNYVYKPLLHCRAF
jgi:hypothetical protein